MFSLKFKKFSVLFANGKTKQRLYNSVDVSTRSGTRLITSSIERNMDKAKMKKEILLKFSGFVSCLLLVMKVDGKTLTDQFTAN